MAGDYIGTDAAGTVACANVGDGVEIDTGASGNTIGGLTATPGTGAGNVISGNKPAAGSTSPAPARPTTSSRATSIGTDVTGTLALANYDGVVHP